MTRPKKEISEAEMKKAEKYAHEGMKNYTICKLMSWSDDWLQSREDIQERLRKKRAEHSLSIQENLNRQMKSKSKGAVTAAIIMAKQLEKDGGLGYTDKQDVNIQGDIKFEVKQY